MRESPHLGFGGLKSMLQKVETIFSWFFIYRAASPSLEVLPLIPWDRLDQRGGASFQRTDFVPFCNGYLFVEQLNLAAGRCESS